MAQEGGGDGIRTHDDREAVPVFKTGAFNQTPPPLRKVRAMAGRPPALAVRPSHDYLAAVNSSIS